MKEVRIAGLKARLSEYLREVRGGETVEVFDRSEPVARIVPYDVSGRLRVRRPSPGAPRPGDLPLPRPRSIKADIVALLLEDRSRR